MRYTDSKISSSGVFIMNFLNRLKLSFQASGKGFVGYALLSLGFWVVYMLSILPLLFSAFGIPDELLDAIITETATEAQMLSVFDYINYPLFVIGILVFCIVCGMLAPIDYVAHYNLLQKSVNKSLKGEKGWVFYQGIQGWKRMLSLMFVFGGILLAFSLVGLILLVVVIATINTTIEAGIFAVIIMLLSFGVIFVLFPWFVMISPYALINQEQSVIENISSSFHFVQEHFSYAWGLMVPVIFGAILFSIGEDISQREATGMSGLIIGTLIITFARAFIMSSSYIWVANQEGKLGESTPSNPSINPDPKHSSQSITYASLPQTPTYSPNHPNK